MSVFSDVLALRYFRKRVISWLAVLAVAVSVFITLVVMTVMNGLADEFKEKNHRLFGDCIVVSDSLVGFAYYQPLMERLQEADFIEAVTPVIKNHGLISLEGGERTDGVNITGIDPQSYYRVTRFADTLYPNSFENPADIFNSPAGEAAPGCIRGIAMMSRRDETGRYPRRLVYNMRLDVSCFPLTAGGTLQKSGTDLVNTKTFIVVNDSESGLPRIDEAMLYMPFEEAQMLCGMGGAEPRTSAIYIKFTDGQPLNASVAAVRDIFDEFKADFSDKPFASLLNMVSVQSWRQYRREAIAPIEKEQIMLMALFFLIGLVTVFVILVVFFLIISHKSRDIGLLKSVGISTAAIVGIFLRFAAAVGITGAAAGSIAGAVFLKYINDLEQWLSAEYGWQVWDRTMYSIGDIPNQISITVVIVIAACAILASLAGAILPVLAAATKHPADSIRVSEV